MTSLPISLPDGFSPSTKVGDQVAVGQIIATKKESSDEIINIPQILKIKRSQVKNSLKKSPGEHVNEGDIIAIKNSLFGANVVLRSRVAGTVTRYERNSGNLIIKTGSSIHTDIENVISPVEGKVSMCNNSEIVISTDKNVIVGHKSVGDKAEGEVFRLEADDLYYLDVRTIGKVVIGDKFSREMLLKGIGIGVTGMIGTEIKDEDIDHITEKKFDTPILEVDLQNLEKLTEWVGKKVFVDAKSKSIIFLQI